MNALYILIPALCLMAIAYRYYSAFLATRVAVLDDTRVTPAHTRFDGHNYYPLSRWVLFGHHFAAITGAGPLIGPVLAAQFGYLPGAIWLVVGVCLGGAVHDFMVLWASSRRGGRSLAEIAHEEIGTVAGVTAAVAILFIIVIALAGLGLAVVNALRDSAWGTFTIGMTIPIAIVMGLYMWRWRKGAVTSATIMGVTALILCVVAGRWVAEAEWGRLFILNKNELVLALAVYGFAASVLPVWLLLAPRDYLSAFMKIGTVAFLILGVTFVGPTLHMPAVSQFAAGGGPIIPGKVFPFVFITIACGAISGFHGLIGSGTTPKMLNRESDIRPIGYGAMLVEGVVGIVALIAATALHPGDYFGINVPASQFAALNIPEVNLAALSAQVGEDVAGRPGGAVSLAVGMAQIFTALPGMAGLMSYWYHFAIMFEALFILTTIDAGTRVARFILQEFAGRLYAPLGRNDSIPAAGLATLAVVVSWAYFIHAGSISTIWPMFGIANQLLATVALAITTIVLVNAGRARYAWVTIVPMLFVATTTISAGILSVRDNFWPMAVGTNPGVRMQGYVNTVLTLLMLLCVGIILVAAALRWRRHRTESTMAESVVATGLALALLWPSTGYAQQPAELFRLVTFEHSGSVRLGATRGEDIVDVHNAVRALRAAGAAETVRGHDAAIDLAAKEKGDCPPS
ncbi:MAG: carbon starvation protein A [Acidobacteria bacterium]|nr:carbon starvation protein A [Acidobacteriota bacterium]